MRVRFEDLCLDSERRELTRGQTSLHLTPKAFDLLALLVERRPAAVSQDDLFDHLWPATLVDLSRLHQLVAEIRHALGDDDRRIIRTVYGRGYAFAPPAVILDAPARSACKLVIGAIPHDLREGTNIVGRDHDVAVRIEHTSVSRRHAAIVIAADRITVEDLGSRNGTFVNSVRIHAATELRDGDALCFGHLNAKLRILPPPAATD
jgi:DNA-binding winged helix-turn-helix (wHTH) protein